MFNDLNEKIKEIPIYTLRGCLVIRYNYEGISYVKFNYVGLVIQD